jgi:cyanate permease
MGMGMGLISVYGFFAAPVADEFGISHVLINSGPIFLLVMPAFLGPVVGRLADRVPIRNLLVLGVLIAMTSLYLMSAANSFRYVTAYFICFTIGSVFYGPISVNALLIKCYRSRAGRALAIAAIGVSIASALLPVCVAWLLEMYGWRQSLAMLSLLLMTILLLSIVFGLASISKQKFVDDAKDTDVIGKGAGFFHQQSFWLIGVAVAISFSASLVLAVCFPPHFLTVGFSKIQAGMFLAAGGSAGLLGKLCVAIFIDRFQTKLKYIAVFFFVLQIIGYSGLLFSDMLYPTLLSMALVGMGAGAFIPIYPILNNAYFDASIIGRVSGAQTPMMLPLGLIGLPLSGYAFDQAGSYQPVIVSVIVAVVLAAVLLLKLPSQQTSGHE